MTGKPHDALFKATYRIPSEAQRHIETFHSDIAENLDFSTLKLDDSSYVTETLEEFFSDVSYNCFWKGKTPIKISLLFEHKSYYDKKLPLQLFIYIGQIWAKQLKSNLPPTIVLPIVLYHGEEKFHYQKIENIFGKTDPKLKSFLPNFDYLVTNLDQFSDQDLLDLQSSILFSTASVFKHKRDWGHVIKNIDILLSFENSDYERYASESFLKSFFSYLWNVFEDQPETNWEDLKKGIPVNSKRNVMTIMESFIHRGREEGKQQTAQKAVESIIKKFPGLLNAEIAEMIDVSIDFVKDIRNKISKSTKGRKAPKQEELSNELLMFIKHLISKFPQISNEEISKSVNIPLEKIAAIRNSIQE